MGARDRIGAQVAAKNIGESGCYFLAILKAGRPDAIDEAMGQYWEAIDEGWIDDDCLVKHPGALLSCLACRKFAGKITPDKPEGWAPADYQPQPGEIEILRFEVQKTGVTYSHFVLGDGKGGVAWDPWPGSLTVKNGKLQSKRIFSPIV
jgi:hypothetical protein